MSRALIPLARVAQRVGKRVAREVVDDVKTLIGAEATRQITDYFSPDKRPKSRGSKRHKRGGHRTPFLRGSRPGTRRASRALTVGSQVIAATRTEPIDRLLLALEGPPPMARKKFGRRKRTKRRTVKVRKAGTRQKAATYVRKRVRGRGSSRGLPKLRRFVRKHALRVQNESALQLHRNVAPLHVGITANLASYYTQSLNTQTQLDLVAAEVRIVHFDVVTGKPEEQKIDLTHEDIPNSKLWVEYSSMKWVFRNNHNSVVRFRAYWCTPRSDTSSLLPHTVVGVGLNNRNATLGQSDVLTFPNDSFDFRRWFKITKTQDYELEVGQGCTLFTSRKNFWYRPELDDDYGVEENQKHTRHIMVRVMGDIAHGSNEVAEEVGLMDGRIDTLVYRTYKYRLRGGLAHINYMWTTNGLPTMAGGPTQYGVNTTARSGEGQFP